MSPSSRSVLLPRPVLAPRHLPAMFVVAWSCVSAARAQEPPSGSGPQPAPASPTGTDPRGEGTKKMAALLAKIVNDTDPERNRYFNPERVVMFNEKIARAAGKMNEPALRQKLAIELLQVSRPEEAIAELDRAEKAWLDTRGEPDAGFSSEIQHWRALAWLRLGEQENCLCLHCGTSCILPIEAGGLHREKRGSEHAIELYTQLLETDPKDVESRWLLNLAHMTLGTWPAGVPERWRIDPKAFESQADIGKFRDVAPELGLTTNSISGGICTEDFDLDGVLDLMVSSMGFREQLRLFYGKGDGTFVERTHEAGLDGLTGGLNMVHADYDNDGYADVLVLRGAWMGEQGRYPKSLLHNRRDGTFEDVTEAAGVLSFHPTQTAAWADFDNDGWVDFVVGNETERESPNEPCELFLNQRDGTFKNVAREVGAEIVAFVKGVAAGDIDNDGRVDLYYSIRGETNRLLHNEPSTTEGSPGFHFRDISGKAGVGMPKMSFPTWFFDYDNDGWLDIFVAAFNPVSNADIGSLYLGEPLRSELSCLYHNEGNGRFKEVAKEAGVARTILTMGCNFGDLDNDGWLDFYLANGAPDYGALLPNRMFRSDHGKRFQDVTSSTGTGHLQKGHGVAFADLDNDGDQDVYLKVGGGFSGDVYPSAVFENPGHANHWITLRLRGVKANRFAIGARIRVDVTTPQGDRAIHVVCGTGGSFGSESLQQEIGLGDATAIRAITIRWPGPNTEQRFENVGLDRCLLAVEGESALQVIPQKSFKLGGTPSGSPPGVVGGR